MVVFFTINRQYLQYIFINDGNNKIRVIVKVLDQDKIIIWVKRIWVLDLVFIVAFIY